MLDICWINNGPIAVRYQIFLQKSNLRHLLRYIEADATIHGKPAIDIRVSRQEEERW